MFSGQIPLGTLCSPRARRAAQPDLPLRFKPHLRHSALPSRARNSRVTPHRRASPAIAGHSATSAPARLPPRPPAMITSQPARRPLRATERRPPPSALIAATGDRLRRAALLGPAARPRPGTARGARPAVLMPPAYSGLGQVERASVSRREGISPLLPLKAEKK